MQLTEGRDGSGEVQGSTLTLARIAERPNRLAIGRRYGHLDRMLDTGLSADLLHVPHGPFDPAEWILPQAERESEEEQRLRVGRSLDAGIQRRINRHQQISFDLVEAADGAVVHPKPLFVTEGMAVGALHRRSRRGSDVGKQNRRANLARKLAEILVIPRRLDVLEQRRSGAVAVPPDAETIAVGGGGTHTRVQALVDQRVRRTKEHVLHQDRVAGVSHPSTHEQSETRPTTPRITRHGVDTAAGGQFAITADLPSPGTCS